MYKQQPQGGRYVNRADLARISQIEKQTMQPKRHTGPLPVEGTPDGQPFVGPDGKLYFRSHSGHIYPAE